MNLPELYKAQNDVEAEVKREISNFKRTGRSRRTNKYRDGKLKTAADLWKKFSDNDTDILLKLVKPDDVYKFKEDLMKLYEWVAELQAINEAAPFQPDPNADQELVSQLKQQNVRFPALKKVLNDVQQKIEDEEELTSPSARRR